MSLSVLMPHETLAQLALPDMIDVRTYVLSRDDCLVLCGGFEDRAVGVLENAISTQTPFHVILIRYEPQLAANKVGAIRSMCAGAGVSVRELAYNTQAPAGFGDALATLLAEHRGKVFLDVSAMSRLLIVQAIVALGGRPSGLADCFV